MKEQIIKGPLVAPCGCTAKGEHKIENSDDGVLINERVILNTSNCQLSALKEELQKQRNLRTSIDYEYSLECASLRVENARLAALVEATKQEELQREALIERLESSLKEKVKL